MNEAKKLQVKNPYTIHNLYTVSNTGSNAKKRNYNEKPAPTKLLNPITFPRSVEEIYAMGIGMQYYIGDVYLKLAGTKGPNKSSFEAMAMEQLVAKKEIQKLANININEKLAYFYNNGGPVIEPPISEAEAKELNGFYNRIIANALNQIELTISKGNLSPQDLGNEINTIIISLFNSLANLYQLNEMKQAFLEMARIKAQS